MSEIIQAIAVTIREIGQPNINDISILAYKGSEVAKHDTIIGMQVKVTSAYFNTSHGHDFVLIGGFENNIPEKFDREFYYFK